MEVSTGMAVEDDPESMLARMLTPAHSVADEPRPQLTLEQIRGALTGSSSELRTRTSLILDQLRGVLAARSPRETHAPHSPDPPPSLTSTLPMNLVDQTLNIDFEVLNRKEDETRIMPAADRSLRDFNEDTSAAMDSEPGGASAPRRHDDGVATTTVAQNDQHVANVQAPSNMNNGYHVEEARWVPPPVRERPRAASVVPDICITPLPAAADVVAPRSASAPAALATPPACRVAPRAVPAPAAASTPRASHVAPGLVFTSTPRVSVVNTTEARDVAAAPTVTAAAAAFAVTACTDAQDDGRDSPYDDNRLLVEMQNPDRKGAKKPCRRPRLLSRPAAPPTPPPPPPPGTARRHGRENRADVLRGFKRKLQSFLQVEQGKDVTDEEMDALLVGPTYDRETLDEAQLFEEFVQIAVTTVFEPVPCTRQLRAALLPRADADADADTAAAACVSPASLCLHVTDVTKAAKVSSVSVEHAACRPGDTPFKEHEFRGASSAPEPASVRAVRAHGARMRDARAALARAAARLARQLQVVRQLTARLPACEAGLEARLPARTLAEFQRLDADLKASPALRGELMSVYRALAGAASTSREGIRGIMERTLQPPVDAHYSGSGRAYRGVQKADYSATAAYACLRDAIKEKFGVTENLDNLRSRVGQWLCGKNDRPAATS